MLSLGNTDESFLIEQRFVDTMLNMQLSISKGEDIKENARWGYQQIMNDQMDYYTIFEKNWSLR